MVLEINGIELSFEVVGEGEPLLWLHGFMGVGADWKYVFEEPPAGFRLIAP
jgi:pimeloyl-ACP methyl ester carboxylesterase